MREEEGRRFVVSLTVLCASAGDEDIAVNHGEQGGVPAGPTVWVVRPSPGPHEVCGVEVWLSTRLEDPDAVPSITKAIDLSQIISANHQNRLISQPDVARAEEAVICSHVTVAIGVEIKDSSHERLQRRAMLHIFMSYMRIFLATFRTGDPDTQDNQINRKFSALDDTHGGRPA